MAGSIAEIVSTPASYYVLCFSCSNFHSFCLLIVVHYKEMLCGQQCLSGDAQPIISCVTGITDMIKDLIRVEAKIDVILNTENTNTEGLGVNTNKHIT